MTADAWTPVEMRWRLVRAGDVVLDPNGAPWMVDRNGDARLLTLSRGVQEFDKCPDPDTTVRVLVPYIEAAGVVALREQLGPVRVLGRNGT